MPASGAVTPATVSAHPGPRQRDPSRRRRTWYRERVEPFSDLSANGGMMERDWLDLYERATTWTASMMPGAAGALDAPTLCDDWNVAMLLNHMLDRVRPR